MIRVIGDRVLVAIEPEPDEKVTDSGIILKRDPDLIRTPVTGVVVQVGEKVNTCDVDDVRSEIHTWFVEEAEAHSLVGLSEVGDILDRILMRMTPAGFDVQPGDVVVFPRYVGEEIMEGDLTYVVLRESEIIGTVTKNSEAA